MREQLPAVSHSAVYTPADRALGCKVNSRVPTFTWSRRVLVILAKVLRAAR